MLARAEELHKRAFAARKRRLGGRHPASADSLYNLGCVFEKMGTTRQARKYFEAASVVYRGYAHKTKDAAEAQQRMERLAERVNSDKPAPAAKVLDSKAGHGEVTAKEASRGLGCCMRVNDAATLSPAENSPADIDGAEFRKGPRPSTRGSADRPQRTRGKPTGVLKALRSAATSASSSARSVPKGAQGERAQTTSRTERARNAAGLSSSAKPVAKSRGVRLAMEMRARLVGEAERLSSA
jgi:hypothetical protein